MYAIINARKDTHTMQIRLSLAERSKLYNQGLKQCLKCNGIKMFDEFTADVRQFDKHYPYCKQCEKEKHAAMYVDNPDKVKATVRKWTDNNPDKTIAHHAVRNAVWSGEIEKPIACSVCGSTDKRIVSHHCNGYEKEHWLDVVWVCDNCHRKLHKSSIVCVTAN